MICDDLIQADLASITLRQSVGGDQSGLAVPIQQGMGSEDEVRDEVSITLTSIGNVFH